MAHPLPMHLLASIAAGAGLLGLICALVVGMALSIDKLIARTQASIDTETDPKKLRTLQASLAAHLATKAEMDDDEGDEGDDDEDSKAKKAAAAAAKAKGKAEAAKHRAKAAEYKQKMAESEEAAKKAEAAGEEDEDEEEESEEAKKAAAAALAAPGQDLLARLAESVAKIERSQVASTKTALISGARKLGAITKTEATWLAAQGLPAVESFLEMRSKAGLVATSEDALVKPKDAKPGTEESLPAETLQMIEAAVNVWTGDKVAYRKVLVESHLAAHAKQVSAALNGAPGRY